MSLTRKTGGNLPHRQSSNSRSYLQHVPWRPGWTAKPLRVMLPISGNIDTGGTASPPRRHGTSHLIRKVIHMAGFTPLLLRAGMRPRSLWRQWRHPNARRVAVRTLLTLILVTLFAGSALAWHTSSAKAHSAASASSLQHLAASSQKSTISQQTVMNFAPWGWLSNPSQREWLSGDFNGDGQTDIVYLWDNNGYVEAYTAFAKGDGSFTVNGSSLAFGSETWGWISDPSVHQWFASDFNGDGKTDLAYLWDNNGYVEVYTAFSNGAGSFSTASAAPGWAWLDPSNRYWLDGSFNGDGKTDLAYLWNNNGTVEVYSAFSSGAGTFAVAATQLAF